MRYIYQQERWPAFTWQMQILAEPLATARFRQGLLFGQMNTLLPNIRSKAGLETFTLELLNSASLDGEDFCKDELRSIFAHKLGINIGETCSVGKEGQEGLEALVNMLLDAVNNCKQPLDALRLQGWCAQAGCPESRLKNILHTAKTGVKQLLSGHLKHYKINFEPLPAADLEQNLTCFLNWLNAPLQTNSNLRGPDKNDLDPFLEAGIAYLWFMTIQPFGANSGQMGRAIINYVLARAAYEDSRDYYFSISEEMTKHCKEHYAMLSQTQRGDLDITAWLLWFIKRIHGALDQAFADFGAVMRKARIWESASFKPLNVRQKQVLNYMLDNSLEEIVTDKYAKAAKCSPDTAWRDIRELVELNVLGRNPEKGRRTSYFLVDEAQV